MTARIFLDWYGVLCDVEDNGILYSQSLVHVLVSRFGGEPDRWREAVELAFREYEDVMRGALEADNLLTATAAANLFWVDRLFHLAGRRRPPGDRLRLARELDAEASRGAGSLLPDVRPTLEMMRARGFGLSLVTNASRDHIAGVLKASGLAEAFDAVYTALEVGLPKTTPAFWTRVLRASGTDPSMAVVVDDRPSVLRAAAALGVHTVLVGDGPPPHAFTPEVAIRGIAELPGALAALIA